LNCCSLYFGTYEWVYNNSRKQNIIVVITSSWQGLHQKLFSLMKHLKNNVFRVRFMIYNHFILKLFSCETMLSFFSLSISLFGNFFRCYNRYLEWYLIFFDALLLMRNYLILANIIVSCFWCNGILWRWTKPNRFEIIFLGEIMSVKVGSLNLKANLLVYFVWNYSK